MSNVIDAIQSLTKALEAGGYNVMPSNLTQGSALMVEDLSSVMELVTFDDSHLKLAKMLKVESCKSTLAQFNRQLSYGSSRGKLARKRRATTFVSPCRCASIATRDA